MSQWLMVLIITTALLGCGDPGTGGSGVPSGSAAQGATGSNSAPATDLNSPATTTANPAPSLLAQTLSGTLQAFDLTLSPQRLTLADQIFDIATAAVFASDGSPLTLNNLQVGQLLTLQFSSAANGATNTLPRVNRIDITASP